MIDVMLKNGDLVPTSYGDIAFSLNDSYDIIQSINNNIMTILGENIEHPEVGNAVYSRRLLANETGFSTVEDDCTNAILFDKRVSNVVSIDASQGDSGVCEVSYVIETVDGIILDSSINISVF